MSTNGLIREQQALARSIAQKRRLSKAEFIKEYISKVDPIVIKIFLAMPESDFYVAPPVVTVSEPVPQTVSSGPGKGAVNGRDGRSAEAHGSNSDIITQSKSDPLGAAQSSDEIVHNVTSAHQVSSAVAKADTRAVKVKVSEKAEVGTAKVREAAPKALQETDATKVAKTAEATKLAKIAEAKAVTEVPAQATNDDAHKVVNDKARTASGLGASIQSPVTLKDGLVSGIAAVARSATESGARVAHQVVESTAHVASAIVEKAQEALPVAREAMSPIGSEVAAVARSATESGAGVAHQVADATAHVASAIVEKAQEALPIAREAMSPIGREIAAVARSATESGAGVAHQVADATAHVAAVAREAMQGAIPAVIDAKNILAKDIKTSISSASANAEHMTHQVGDATAQAVSVLKEKFWNTFSFVKYALSPSAGPIATNGGSSAESVAVAAKDVMSPAQLSTQGSSSDAKHKTENVAAQATSVVWGVLEPVKQSWASLWRSKAPVVDNLQSETTHHSAEPVDKCRKNLFADSCNSAKCLTADECAELGGEVKGEDCIYKCLS